MCKNAVVNGLSREGGYGEYATIRSEAAVRIPKDMDPAEAAPLLCAGVTVFNGMRQMGITAGDTVAVQGLGGLGESQNRTISRHGGHADRKKVIWQSSTRASWASAPWLCLADRPRRPLP